MCALKAIKNYIMLQIVALYSRQSVRSDQELSFFVAKFMFHHGTQRERLGKIEWCVA